MAYIGRGLDKLSNVDVLDAITFTNSAGPYNITKSSTAFIPSAVQNLLNPNLYDHEFFVSTTIISGQLTCQVFGVVDTIIYNYVWTTVANPGIVLGNSDTLFTDSSIVITTDYVVTVTNTNGCFARDTIRVKKDLNTLALDSIVITPVRPCYGDLTEDCAGPCDRELRRRETTKVSSLNHRPLCLCKICCVASRYAPEATAG